MSNVKNYTEQGGEKTVIGGILEIAEGGQIVGLPSSFTKTSFQANSIATDAAGIVLDFNRLLDKLKASGLMSSDAPVITITNQPEDVALVAGSISGSLTVAATVTLEGELSYQWYSNTTDSNTGGTIIPDATTVELSIPVDLTEGTYYYYCVVSSLDAATVKSEAATVTVSAE